MRGAVAEVDPLLRPADQRLGIAAGGGRGAGILVGGGEAELGGPGQLVVADGAAIAAIAGADEAAVPGAALGQPDLDADAAVGAGAERRGDPAACSRSNG